MIVRLFSPTLSHRLFDPMPLPKRARVVAGRSRVAKNRVITPEDHTFFPLIFLAGKMQVPAQPTHFHCQKNFHPTSRDIQGHPFSTS